MGETEPVVWILVNTTSSCGENIQRKNYF